MVEVKVEEVIVVEVKVEEAMQAEQRTVEHTAKRMMCTKSSLETMSPHLPESTWRQSTTNTVVSSTAILSRDTMVAVATSMWISNG